MLKTIKLLQEIKQNLDYIKSLRPLSKVELEELKKSLGVMFTYNSNAMEGNTISLGETKLVLEDGLTIGGKTVRELQETINHKELLDFLYDFLAKDLEIDEAIIKKVHELVMKGIDKEAGNYRKIQVYISGEEKLPPKAKEVEKKMAKLIVNYQNNLGKKEIAILVSEFHYDFVQIHPFVDGNGRVIRLLLNMILMSQWFPMIILPVVRRSEYIACLSSSSTKYKFVVFMLETINENLKDYIRMVDS